jgi:hypothetical protein
MSIKQPVGSGVVVIGGEACPDVTAISWPNGARGDELERFLNTEFLDASERLPVLVKQTKRPFPFLRKQDAVYGNGIKDCGQCGSEAQGCPFRYTIELIRDRATALGFTAMSVAELREAE